MRLYLILILLFSFSLNLMAIGDSPEMIKALKGLVKESRKSFVFFESGSGVIISQDGLVLTNAHVLVKKQAVHNVRIGNGKSYKAKVLGLDPFGDLALLKLENAAGLKFLKLADTDKTTPGELCFALGNPFAFGLVDQTPTVTFGVVSALNQYHGSYSDAIVTDAPINPGNSGGPLINSKGELLGINGLIKTRLGLRSNTGLAYTIPAHQIKLWIEKLKNAKGQAVLHGRLFGLAFEDQTVYKGKGIKISEIQEGRDAKQAGLKVNDIILSINHYEVWSPQRFLGIIGIYPAGEKININIKRNGRKLTLPVTLQEFRKGHKFFTIKKPEQKDKFLRINTVKKGSIAERMGLRAGDRIKAIEGRELKDSVIIQYLEVNNFLNRFLAGWTLNITIQRTENGKLIEKKIAYPLG